MKNYEWMASILRLQSENEIQVEIEIQDEVQLKIRFNLKDPRSCSSEQCFVQLFTILVWFGLQASVFIPPIFINLTCKLATSALKSTNLRPSLKASLPTALGLAVIPLIVHPIDSAVETGMENYFRPYLRAAVDKFVLKETK